MSAPDATLGEDHWQGDCAEDPAMWDDFLDGVDETPTDRRDRLALAVDICGTCPLLRACERALAAQTAPVSGVWAGRLVGRREPTLRPLLGPTVCTSPGCCNLLPPRDRSGAGPPRMACSKPCGDRASRARRKAA